MADGTIVIDTSIDKKKIDSQVSSIRSNVEAGFKNIAKIAGAALATATAAVGAFAVSSVKDFIVFEDKMNEVFTLLPGASTAMKDSMMEDVKALSKEMGVLPEDVIPAVYQALSAGIPPDNVFDFVRTSSKLATAGVAEMDDAVGVLTTVVNNYAKEGLTAEEASNMLFTAVKDGVTSVPELATKLGDVVPIAASLGIGFDEVAGATGAMTAIMGKGSTMKAVTNMRGMLNELGKEGTAADEAFQSVAGVGFTEFIEKGGTLQEAMGVLKTASIENNTSINNLFGSIEAGQAALILAGDGAEKFATVLDNMHNSTGATEAAFQTMTESTQFSMDKIKANIATLKLDLAQKLIPSFDSLLTSVMGIFDGSEGATQNFVDTLVETIGSLLDVIIPMIIDLTPKLVDGAGEIVMAIVQGISDNTDQLSDAVVTIVMAIVDFITENLPEIIAVTLKLIMTIAKGIIANIPEIISALVDMTGEMISEIVKVIPDFLQAGKNVILGLWQGIKDNAMKPVDAIKDLGGKMVDGFKNLFGIKSPSKVMAEIGGYIDEGLAKGIRESEGVVATSWQNLGANLVYQANDWVGTIQSVIGTLKGAFADTMTGIGEAIATGGLSWDIFAKAGLNALADVLAAIGQQLTAMAVLKTVQLDWSGAAIAGAGATAAFIASGMIKGVAASYDVGGIIDRDQLANIHQGETILPKGITADMKSAGLMIQPLGRNSATSPTMYGIINLDGREIARAVFKHTDSNVGLAYTG